MMGVPVAMVVSPLLLGAATLLSDLINLFTPSPDVVAGIGRLADWPRGPADFPLFYGIIALPGVALVLLGWAAVRRLLLRGGVGGVLLGLGAREPPQAIIGHLVASTGNGDLAIAHRMVSVHATLGLIEALTFVAVNPEGKTNS